MHNITICIQCENFQRRLAWMLSSLLPQRDGVVVNVACRKHNGEPSTELLRDAFCHQGLDVRLLFMPYERLQFRGLTRTAQLHEVDTPWVLWADADHVYHPDFFGRLRCDMSQYGTDFRGMLSAGRWSNPPEDTERMMATRVGYGPLVLRAWERAAALPKIRRRNCGAGYFQLVRTAAHGGYYVATEECRDHGWTNTFSKCRSDQQFRHRIGQRVSLPPWFSENQIHLNHARDNEAGKHLEVQR